MQKPADESIIFFHPMSIVDKEKKKEKNKKLKEV
jgi:hypothetical protein